MDCVHTCFGKGGTLLACGNACGAAEAGAALANAVESAVLCAATSCGGPTQCNPMGATSADAGDGG